MRPYLEFLKRADLATPLLPHQQRVVDRIRREDQPGLVVVHGLGSGKTLTSIAAQDALRMPATAVVPAALQANYEKERQKHLRGPRQPVRLETLQRVARRGQVTSNPLLVVDEAHRLRESGGKGSQAVAKTTADKRLLLTGSPFYNRPEDLSSLVNVAAGQSVLPTDEKAFGRRYLKTKVVRPGLWGRLRGIEPGEEQVLNKDRRQELRDIYGKWVDYHPGSTEGFPEVTREEVRVPMSRTQLALYDALAKTAPASLRAKVEKGLPPNKREAANLNAFLSAVRQVTTSTAAHQAPGAAVEAPKVDAAFGRLQKTLGDNPAAKAVVYSNFLEAGIDPYKARLQAAGIPYGEFTGAMDGPARDQLVRDYNEGKLRALLLSSAGGEGLDLKGTRLLQVLEPHWNEEKLRQVEGRGARYQSHSHLPEAERTMHVERYLAERPKGFLERAGFGAPKLTADEYLARHAREKDQLLGQFRQMLGPAPTPNEQRARLTRRAPRAVYPGPPPRVPLKGASLDPLAATPHMKSD